VKVYVGAPSILPKNVKKEWEKFYLKTLQVTDIISLSAVDSNTSSEPRPSRGSPLERTSGVNFLDFCVGCCRVVPDAAKNRKKKKKKLVSVGIEPLILDSSPSKLA